MSNKQPSEQEEYPPLNIRCHLTLNASPEDLGREVRRVWVEWAERQPNPKPHWLDDYDSTTPAQREVDCLIGEAVAKFVMTNLSDDTALRASPVATTYDLSALKEAAIEACNKARERRRDIKEPVNWSSLGCLSSELATHDNGLNSYRVYLIGASDSCVRLREFISDSLEAAGFQGVEVHTEW